MTREPAELTVFTATDREFAVEYGVIRHADREGRKSWYVSVRRHGIQVRRSFHDAMWGGEQEALEMAIAYRKDVTAVLPPMTTRAVHTKVKKNNTSGISGVQRIVSKSGAHYWIASLDSKDRKLRGKFSVAEHGEERAKKLAIAFREQALAETEQRFVTFDPIATAVTDRQFGDRLDEQPVSALHQPLISKAELEAKVAEIDAHYDTLVPSRLTVYLRISPRHDDKLLVRIAGGVRGARCGKARATSCSFKQNSFATAMARARSHIERAIADFYDADMARRFMVDHAEELSDEGFDRENGFNANVVMEL